MTPLRWATTSSTEKQLDFPLLGANATHRGSGNRALTPCVIHTVDPDGGKKIKVGILGLVTPGLAIWGKANVHGKVALPGIVEQAVIFVPRMKAAGADLVIVSCHSGAGTSSSYGDALPYQENASTLLAPQVLGIDAILVRHAHQEIPERFVTNEQTGSRSCSASH